MNWGALGAGAGAIAFPMMAASALETGANLYMQNKTNKTNKQIADEANLASAEQAKKQMDFQAEMSNTSYQRGMEDMRKAGLNPILAYSQGGASAPSGAAGSVTAAKMEAPQIHGLSSSAASAANTALQMRRDDSSIALQDQQAQSTAAQTQKTVADTERSRVGTANDIAAAKRQAQIHNDTSSARQLQKMQADFDRNTLQYDKINEKIQKGANTVESVGDAVYSLLPGGKFIKNLMGRNASSAKDLQKGYSPTKHYVPKKTATHGGIKYDPKTGEF